jgi:diguanylate cyclase (GGDEF)-like protein
LPSEYPKPDTSGQAFRISTLLAEFRDRKAERAFLLHNLAVTQSALRISLIFSAIFCVLLVAADVGAVGYTHDTVIAFLNRVLFAVVAVGLLYWVGRWPRSVVVQHFAATVVDVVGMAVLMGIAWRIPAEIPSIAMAFGFWVIAVYLFIPNRLACSAVVAIVGSVAFLIVFKLKAINGVNAAFNGLTIGLLLLTANCAGLLAAHRGQIHWRREFRVQMVLRERSARDYLTGCFDRRYLHDVLLPSEIARSRRYKFPMSIVVCDIDHFKMINEMHGHRSGDAVMRHLASLFMVGTRAGIDSVVRYGGDELLLLLPQTRPEDAVKVAERLRLALANSPARSEAGQELPVTASFGVVGTDFSLTGDFISEASLIDAAESALVVAKNSGRNNVQVAA